ncbi:hypothetical protein C8J57DRAFT_997506, partial [Mycena rebaudengoi]
TETVIIPLRARRFSLALGYLQYLLSLPSSLFAWAALNSSLELAAQETKCWARDL